MHSHILLVDESISCLYKKVKCVRKREGREGKSVHVRDFEKSAEKDAVWYFAPLRMCYQFDGK